MTSTSESGHLSPEEIREKYRIEREKRLRSDGTAQFKTIAGEWADFGRDPFADPNFTRDAVREETEVVIVGAGFGGMLAAHHLLKAGITNFRMIDLAGDFGGTWYWNRYPNCACDVESYVYLPLLEETGYMPTEKYVKAYEIFAYCQLLGRTLDLYPRALFQTEVEDMRWDDESQRWHTTTSRGDDLSSKFVIIAGGVLHRPKLPDVEGIRGFKGHMFHTSRWDYAYTGGSPTEKMVNLADKRVGIIGTGATAVQAVPKLAEACKELYVFQRTPALVGKRNNKPTDPEWFRTLQPGWQAERIANFT
ncbi:MAG: NAD(P)/FAD-dependent oxidoreductase, partial [Ilumatobacteraceae bacterium]|nr:NAD(P)/FAD-dependent oxidoreductase [Ilumatobacteraceae bacterium]